MLRQVASHLRSHTIAFLALFFALGGGASAIAKGKPFVEGSGGVDSGAIDVAATPIDEYVPGVTVGPTIASVEEFGDIYVYACVQATGRSLAGAVTGFRNTSASVWEGTQTGSVAPGESVQFIGAGNALLSSGLGENSRVASIVVDISWDEPSATCRFKVQVVVTS